ncbi:MFS transporter [Patescibacteria group bacterium]
MATTASRFLRSDKSFHFNFPTIPRLIGFSLVMFFITMADSVMSYVSPVYIESRVNNGTMMGILIGSSSFLGFFADLFIGKMFANKRYNFYVLWTILIGLLFPLVYWFFSPTILVLLMGMGVWGIYYELLEFSNFHFIHEYQDRSSHVRAWGVLQAFRSIAWMLAPIVSSSLLSQHVNLAFSTAVGLFVFAMFAFLIFDSTLPKKKHSPHEKEIKRTIWEEFTIWGVLLKKVWPVWLFTIVIYLVDATFWTTGAVLSEKLKEVHPYGSWLLSLYVVPFLFGGLVTKRLGDSFGKKRVAFFSGLFSGLLLIAAGLVSNVSALLIVVFMSSVFTSIAIPEIMATSEDFVGRLKFFGNDMVGLERSAVSIAYVLGPVLAGYLAETVGYQETFSVMGGILVFFSIITLVFSPRKIRLPQRELATILVKRIFKR